MGLLSIIKKIKQKEKEIRILILGLDNSGLLLFTQVLLLLTQVFTQIKE